MLVSVYLINKSNNEDNNNTDDKSLEDIHTLLNNGYNSLSESYDEFNESVIKAFKELDEKQQELLVLYDIIKEKETNSKRDLSNISSIDNKDYDKDNVLYYNQLSINDAINMNNNVKKQDNVIDNIVQKKSFEQDGVAYEKQEVKYTKELDKMGKSAFKAPKDISEDKVLNNKKAKDVMLLKNKGYDAKAISKELNMGKAEVDLILSLGGK